MDQVRSKLVPSWLKLAQVDPRWLQVGSSWAKVAPIWRQDGPSGWQDSDKYAQVDAKMGEVGTQTDHMRLNLVPSGPRLSQIWPQRCMKDVIARYTKTNEYH